MALEPIDLNPGTGGDSVAADDLGADGKAQVIKLVIGADGVNDGLVASGNPLPVTAVITSLPNEGQQTMANSVSVAIASNQSAIPVDGSGVTQPVSGTVAVTGVSTLAEQQTQTTALQLLDDAVYTDDTSTHTTAVSKGLGIMAVATPTDAAVGANEFGHVAMTLARELKVDASGVAVPVTDNSSSLSVDWNGTQPVTGSGTATGALRVELANNGTGIVGVSALPASTNTIEVVGDVAAGVAVAGNPVRMGFRADTTAPSAVSDGQCVDPWADEFGAQWIKPSLNQLDIAATPTIATAVYQSGDHLGSVVTFANAAIASGRSGTIVGAKLTDDAPSAFDIRLHIFKLSPTMTSTDNNPIQITDANIATAIYVGTIEFLSSNGHSFTDNRVVQGTWLDGPPVIPYVTSGSSSLFGILEARGAYDAVATDDLVVTISVVRD